jgi:large subunit ribosomal protein L25
MAVLTLNAQKRENLGNSVLKTNRKKGNVPGVFYIKGTPTIPIYVKDTILHPFIFTSEVNIINLKIEGTDSSYNCIIKDIQFDPVTDKPIHFDLLGISEKEKIKLEIPILLVGTPVGIKDGGIIQHPVHRVEIECLPKDIPSHIEVNIENLKIGDSVHVSEIQQVNFEILDSPDTTIVAVVPPVIEKEPEVVVEGEAAEGEEAAEPEVIAKGKKEEEGEGEEKEKKEEKKEKKEEKKEKK